MGGIWKGQTWLSWGGGSGPWCELWPPRTGAWGHADPCPFPSQPSVSLPCASPILALLPAELQGLPEGLMGVAVSAEPPQKLSLTALATAQQHGCGGLQHISLLSGLQPPAKDQGRIQKLRLKMLLSRDVPKPQHCLEELPPVPAWAREPWGTALGCGGWQGQPPRPLFFSHQSSAGQHCAAGRGVTVLLRRGKVAAVAALLAQELGSACGIALPSQHGTRAGVSRTDSLWPTFSLCCQPHGLWLTRTPGTA